MAVKQAKGESTPAKDVSSWIKGKLAGVSEEPSRADAWLSLRDARLAYADERLARAHTRPVRERTSLVCACARLVRADTWLTPARKCLQSGCFGIECARNFTFPQKEFKPYE